ncbi:hypothetical protein ES705_20207 [subsurface metagenome]
MKTKLQLQQVKTSRELLLLLPVKLKKGKIHWSSLAKILFDYWLGLKTLMSPGREL